MHAIRVIKYVAVKTSEQYIGYKNAASQHNRSLAKQWTLHTG